MKTLCITIDCDGHGFDIPVAFNHCFELLKEHGISDVTWFVNERDYGYTLKYSNILEKAINLGEIGLHTHLNGLWKYKYCIPDDYNLIHNAIKEDKEVIETWLCSKGYRKRIISFRSGNLLTNAVLFEVLSEIGFKVDSSIPAIFEWKLREAGRKIVLKAPVQIRNAICRRIEGCAYSTVPIAKKLYEIGKVLEIPLNMYVGGRYLNFEWLKRSTETVFNRGHVLVIYFHPFDLIMFGMNTYREYISWLLERYNPKVSTLSDVYDNYIGH